MILLNTNEKIQMSSFLLFEVTVHDKLPNTVATIYVDYFVIHYYIIPAVKFQFLLQLANYKYERI